MPSAEWFVYRSIRVSRDPQGNDIVIGDSAGNPASRGRENAHLVFYLDGLGRDGWEVCGTFGHIGAVGSGGYKSNPEATILLKQRRGGPLASSPTGV